VRRLLAIKRHERPPQNYFSGFTEHVVEAIRSPNQRASRGFSFSSWWAAFTPAWVPRPEFVGVLALVVFVALIWSVGHKDPNAGHQGNATASFQDRPGSLQPGHLASQGNVTGLVVTPTSTEPVVGSNATVFPFDRMPYSFRNDVRPVDYPSPTRPPD